MDYKAWHTSYGQMADPEIEKSAFVGGINFSVEFLRERAKQIRKANQFQGKTKRGAAEIAQYLEIAADKLAGQISEI